ncbi:MAG: Ig-like domain-containing protein, partial [Planctomycetota bacterium]
DGPADTIDPRVVINFPVDGTSVVGSVGIQATARDNAGMARAEWFVDGAAKQTTSISGTRAVVNFVWDAASYSSGSHTIAVRITDAGHNRAVAAIALVKE